ncbi:MAG: DUF1194 domain-containing protein [Pseudolabrys sp.]|nr:DUF1194 domain-containing protein [Pseudolabrys sp.]MDP2294459.1 DUF1194 domain-containing protein [Pseudolabrys sp.]
MRRFCAVILTALLAAAFTPPARAAEKVDLLLVLAADVSRSVNGVKFKLQREGYAAAIADGRVIDAIRSGRNQRIAVMFMEWSGYGNQKVVIDWTVIDGPKAAQGFADLLLESPRVFADRTSISGGIDAAIAQFARAPFFAERQTIDVSGDGTNNSGRDVAQSRDEALRLGITINGLVILSDTPLPWNPEHTNPPGGLAKYYRDNVTGGPGSFVIEAKDFNSFGEAIVKKMIAEIADATPAASGRTAIR